MKTYVFTKNIGYVIVTSTDSETLAVIKKSYPCGKFSVLPHVSKDGFICVIDNVKTANEQSDSNDELQFNYSEITSPICSSVADAIVKLSAMFSAPPMLIAGASTTLAGALRVEQLTTDIDLKQTKSALTGLFYDRITNGSATQVWDAASSSTAMGVTSNGDYAIVQTFQRFNYQTGKPKKITLTQFDFQQQAGVEKRFGYFNGGTVAPYNAYDGIFMLSKASGIYCCVANSGTVVSSERANWLDPLDGTGPSGFSVDFQYAQIIQLEFLWLGYGPVVFSIDLNGMIIPFCVAYHTNNMKKPYMLSPNQPVRHEIRSVGGAGTFSHTCATVGSDGGQDPLGITTTVHTGDTLLTLVNIATRYGVIFLRLKQTHLDISVDLIKYGVMSASNDDCVIKLVRNPTIAGTALVWIPLADSALEYAIGAANNILSGGRYLDIDQAKQNTTISDIARNALRPGSKIDGTADIYAMEVTTYSSNLSISATFQMRELI